MTTHILRWYCRHLPQWLWMVYDAQPNAWTCQGKCNWRRKQHTQANGTPMDLYSLQLPTWWFRHAHCRSDEHAVLLWEESCNTAGFCLCTIAPCFLRTADGFPYGSCSSGLWLDGKLSLVIAWSHLLPWGFKSNDARDWSNKKWWNGGANLQGFRTLPHEIFLYLSNSLKGESKYGSLQDFAQSMHGTLGWAFIARQHWQVLVRP